MSKKPKSEGVIYPCNVHCTIKHELPSIESHWNSSEAPKSKIIISSKCETCSVANRIIEYPELEGTHGDCSVQLLAIFQKIQLQLEMKKKNRQASFALDLL